MRYEHSSEALDMPFYEERCVYWIRYGLVWFAGIFFGDFSFYEDKLRIGKKVTINYEDMDVVSSRFFAFRRLITIREVGGRSIYMLSIMDGEVLRVIDKTIRKRKSEHSA